MYKSLSFVVTVLFIGSVGVAQKSKETLSVKSGLASIRKHHMSDLGFEFHFPSCVVVTADYADDEDLPLNQVEQLALMNKCDDRISVKGMSIEKLYIEKDRSAGEAFKMIEDRVTFKGEGSHGNRYFPTKNSSHAYAPIEIFKESGGGGYIRWIHHKLCGKNIIKFQFDSDYTPSEELYKKVKEGDPYIPEIEKRIIDSFKCTAKK